MPSRHNAPLLTRSEMLRVLMRAGQFAHLSEAELGRSLDGLWDTDGRAEWLAEGEGHYYRATWAERAVSLALVKASDMGLMPRGYFDIQTVDWIARTEPTLCCLCLHVGETFKGNYDVPVEFVSYVCPTFETFDAPYYVRRPICGPCSWIVANWERGNAGIGNRPQPHPLAYGPDLWNWVLSRVVMNEKFQERVRLNASNVNLLRFDPRRDQTQEEPK
jgi:hypothetical protein